MADVGLLVTNVIGTLVAQPALAQVGIDDHGDFVGGAEATRARRCADDDRPGVLQEFLVALPGRERVPDCVQTECVWPSGPEPGHLVERELRTGRDHQVVVGHLGAVAEHELRCLGVDPLHDLRDPARSPFAASGPAVRTRVCSRLAPADRHPGVGRRELEVGRAPTSVTLVRGAERLLHFVCAGDAAESRAEYHDLGHAVFPLPPQAARCVRLR